MMSDAMSSAKATLTEKLSDLLGFADGAHDVLEYLLSIESSEDLRIYLSQLLGQDGENVRSFVEDVGKFQRGESLSSATSKSQGTVNKTTDESGSARQRQENYIDGVKRNDRIQERKVQQNNKKPAPKRSAPSAGAAKSHIPPPPKPSAIAAKKAVPPQAVKQAPTSSQVNIIDKKIATLTKPLVPTSPPPKGVASRGCGCYGTIHKPLTNCLHCGRISCSDEGYDYCGFCGFLVSPSAADGGNTATRAGSNRESWLLKERLLRFDREFVRRTEVVDDQEDYYANSTSTWLTEEERHNAQDMAEDRQQELNQSGKKQVLNLQF